MTIIYELRFVQQGRKDSYTRCVENTFNDMVVVCFRCPSAFLSRVSFSLFLSPSHNLYFSASPDRSILFFNYNQTLTTEGLGENET